MKKLAVIFMMMISATVMSKGMDFSEYGFSIEQTVYKVPVEKGITASDVHESIMSKGAELNMKFVGHQPLSKELDARGVKADRLIFTSFVTLWMQER